MPGLFESDKSLTVAIVGSGGREHAIAWRVSQSPRCGKLYAIPGNPGISAVAECVSEPAGSVSAVIDFCKLKNVDFVIVGPEDPLAANMVGELEKAGIVAFGPTGDAARLEADKVFAKQTMVQAAVPTAEARPFTDAHAAYNYVENRELPVVVKAAGLAKGKGVTICYTETQAFDAIDKCLQDEAFGEAGHEIIIEDFLNGVECSVLALVDRKNLFVLPPCQDYKPVGEGQTGSMTGGMGSYCPAGTLSEDELRDVEADVFVPTLDGLMRDKIKYRGCLYAGLMLTKGGPKVLEFNVRFGDPETQPLMARWKGDVLLAFLACSEGKLSQFVESGGIEFDNRAAVAVILCSRGYPGKYATKVPITGVDKAAAREDVMVFHSGTAMHEGQLVTAGGRVLAVTALGDTIWEARQRAYEAIADISFEGMHYRKDIAADAE